MKTRHGVGAIFHHDDRLVVFEVPFFCLRFYIQSNHIRSTWLTVPTVVPVEPNYIQKLPLKSNNLTGLFKVKVPN